MVMSKITDSSGQRNIVHVKELQRASRQVDVIPYDPQQGVYIVESASRPGRQYEVVLSSSSLQGNCTCPWARYGGMNCKHILAALRARYANQGTLSFWRTFPDAQRQHRRILTGNQIYGTLRPHQK
ncbi:MAG: SWIM zinc finger family protein [Chloroflexaceae bacterium]